MGPRDLRPDAAHPEWVAATVGHHRELIAALSRRDAVAAIDHTVWQFTDAASRLTEMDAI